MIHDLPFDFFDRANVAQGLRFNDRGRLGVLRKTRLDRTACAKLRIRRLQARAGRSVRMRQSGRGKELVGSRQIPFARNGIGDGASLCQSVGSRGLPGFYPAPCTCGDFSPANGRTRTNACKRKPEPQQPTRQLPCRKSSALAKCSSSDQDLQSLALSAVMRDFGLHPGFFRDPISPRREPRSDAT
jgi:hypothetical protein